MSGVSKDRILGEGERDAFASKRTGCYIQVNKVTIGMRHYVLL